MKELYLALILLVTGCLNTVVYVCPDGTTADEKKDCINEEIAGVGEEYDRVCEGFLMPSGSEDVILKKRCLLHINPNPQYCNSLENDGIFTRTECLTELAGILNSTNPCQGLKEDGKYICIAVGAKNISTCDVLSDKKQVECKTAVRDFLPKKESRNCSGLSDEDFVWCVVYGAESDQDCQVLNGLNYRNEGLLCRARIRGDVNVCAEIEDETFASFCRRVVLRL